MRLVWSWEGSLAHLNVLMSIIGSRRIVCSNFSSTCFHFSIVNYARSLFIVRRTILVVIDWLASVMYTRIVFIICHYSSGGGVDSLQSLPIIIRIAHINFKFRLFQIHSRWYVLNIDHRIFITCKTYAFLLTVERKVGTNPFLWSSAPFTFFTGRFRFETFL